MIKSYAAYDGRFGSKIKNYVRAMNPVPSMVKVVTPNLLRPLS